MAAAHAVIDGVEELLERYDGFILDQFGVLHDGVSALPGAVNCLQQLHQRGKRLVVLSNTSKRASFSLKRLPSMGFVLPVASDASGGASFPEKGGEGSQEGVPLRQQEKEGQEGSSLFTGAVTSGEEGLQHMLSSGFHGKKAVMLTWNAADSDGFLAALQLTGAPPEEADFVLCQGPDKIVDSPGGEGRGLGTFTNARTTGNLEAYEEVFKACIARDLDMINVNPDLRVNIPKPAGESSSSSSASGSGSGSGAEVGAGQWYMPGYISARYEALGGRVKYFGKPHAAHFDAAVQLLGMPRDRACHVGDSLSHDILGANAAGVDSLFVAAGIHGEALGVDATTTTTSTNSTSSSSALDEGRLLTLFKEHGATPTHSIELFRWQ